MNFNVPDKVWESIVPEPYVNKVVCLECFDKFASGKGIQYAEHLDSKMYFAGEMCSLQLFI